MNDVPRRNSDFETGCISHTGKVRRPTRTISSCGRKSGSGRWRTAWAGDANGALASATVVAALEGVAVQVQAAGGHVGGDQYVQLAGAQLVDDPLAFLVRPRGEALITSGGHAAGESARRRLRRRRPWCGRTRWWRRRRRHRGCGPARRPCRGTGRRRRSAGCRLWSTTGGDTAMSTGFCHVGGRHGADGRRHRGENSAVCRSCGASGAGSGRRLAAKAVSDISSSLVGDREVAGADRLQGAALQVVDDPTRGADDNLGAGGERGTSAAGGAPP